MALATELGLGAVRAWQGPQVLSLALAQGTTSLGHGLEGMLTNPVTQWQAFCHLLLLALQLVGLCVSLCACVCICLCMTESCTLSPDRLKASWGESLGTDLLPMVDGRRQLHQRPSESTRSPCPFPGPSPVSEKKNCHFCF